MYSVFRVCVLSYGVECEVNVLLADDNSRCVDLHIKLAWSPSRPLEELADVCAKVPSAAAGTVKKDLYCCQGGWLEGVWALVLGGL